MGFLDFFKGAGAKDEHVAAKPNRYIDVGVEQHKVPVKGTNDSQMKLRNLGANRNMSFSVTELTEQQLAEGYPPKDCVNLNSGRCQVSTPETWLGYIDAGRVNAHYLRDYVKEYREVCVHGYITKNNGKFRVELLLPKDKKPAEKAGGQGGGKGKKKK